MEVFKLKPGRGIEGILFGMSESDIEDILGKADFIDFFDDEDTGKTRVFYYFDRGLSFYFDGEEDFRLLCFELEAMDIFLFEKNIARISKNKLRDFLFENNFTDLREERDEDQDALVSDKLSASFYFEFDSLISVQLGVFTDSDERPLWP